MAASNRWRRFAERAEIRRLANKMKGLENEARCYKLARDCYKILTEHDAKTA